MPATLRVDTTGQIRAWSREAEELLGYGDAHTRAYWSRNPRN
jgi:hypothetical protein